MGLALAAELNGYPGPMHVLELAERLGLSSEQRAAAGGLTATMRRETIAAGERLIAAEGALNRLFAKGRADEVNLAESIREVAAAQGEVRRLHLKAHIATRTALTAEQIALYAKLRGY